MLGIFALEISLLKIDYQNNLDNYVGESIV